MQFESKCPACGNVAVESYATFNYLTEQGQRQPDGSWQWEPDVSETELTYAELFCVEGHSWRVDAATYRALAHKGD